MTHQANNDGEGNAEGNPEYCKCEQSLIDKLVCEECNLHGEQVLSGLTDHRYCVILSIYWNNSKK